MFFSPATVISHFSSTSFEGVAYNSYSSVTIAIDGRSDLIHVVSRLDSYTLPRRQLLTLCSLSLFIRFEASVQFKASPSSVLRRLNGPLSLSDLRQKRDMNRRTSRHMTHESRHDLSPSSSIQSVPPWSVGSRSIGRRAGRGRAVSSVQRRNGKGGNSFAKKHRQPPPPPSVPLQAHSLTLRAHAGT